MIGFLFKRVLALGVTFAAAVVALWILTAPAETPVLQRIANPVLAALKGDFGTSSALGRPVLDLIVERAGVTLTVAGLAMLLTIAIGLPLGVFTGLRSRALLSRLLMVPARLARAAPHFAIGLVMLLVFALMLRLLPPGGFVPWSEDPAAAARALILPVLMLAIPNLSSLAAAVRNAMAGVQDSAFIVAARARGMTQREAMRRHGIGAALPRALRSLGRQFAVLVAAALMVDLVFYLPGLGRMVFDALAAGDVDLLCAGLITVLASALLARLVGDVIGYTPRRAPENRRGNGSVPQPPRRGALRRTSFWLGALIAAIPVGLGLASLVWLPHGPGVAAGATQPMSAAYWLGTDALGRDLFSLLMLATLTSLVIAVFAVLIGSTIGIPLGLAAGTWGGPPGWLLSGLGGIVSAVPLLLIVIGTSRFLGANAVTLTLLLAIVLVPIVGRVTRDGVRGWSGHGYLDAARLSGMGRWSVTVRHVLPNLQPLFVAQAVALLPTVLLAEAVLSFAGLGVQPPSTSLGALLNTALTLMLQNPLAVLAPGAAIVLMVSGLTLMADALREALDPALRMEGETHALA